MNVRELNALAGIADLWERHATACDSSREAARSRGDLAAAAVFDALATARRECAAELRATAVQLAGRGVSR